MTDTAIHDDAQNRPSLFGRITAASDRVFRNYLPEPLAIVMLLTLAVFVLGVTVQGEPPLRMLDHFNAGFWDLLEFAMQMVLVLVTGHILAATRPFRRLMGALARRVRRPGPAVVLVTVVSMAACWVNWGFGLIMGALFAREVARHVPAIDYRVLIASAYSGFVVWHAGLSGSVPLTAATDGNYLQDVAGLIPTSETLFAPFNLIILAALAIALPVTNRLMLNHGGPTIHARDVDLAPEPDAPEPARETMTPAERLEHSRLLGGATGTLGLVVVGLHFAQSGFELDLNIVNFSFLFAGILLHGTPRRFLDALDGAIGATAGIVVQFPFYAGLMGMLVGSGLAAALTNAFLAVATPETLPVVAFLSAGVLNVLVPSGGGQWAVQGPILMPVADALDADTARVVMGVAWGDAWTNMIQPFWAIPALAVAGLSARDIMGFCLVTLLVSGAVIGLGLTFLP